MTKYRRYRSPYNINIRRFSIYSDLYDKSKKGSEVNVGDEIVILVSNIDEKGRGIGRYLNYTIYVPRATLGEKVRVRLVKREGRNSFSAHVIERLGEVRL